VQLWTWSTTNRGASMRITTMISRTAKRIGAFAHTPVPLHRRQSSHKTYRASGSLHPVVCRSLTAKAFTTRVVQSLIRRATHGAPPQTSTRVHSNIAPKAAVKFQKRSCSWQARPGSACVESFAYKGVEYNGCALVDHPTPWCSHDKVHSGSWTACERVCGRPSEQEPDPTPYTEKAQEDPCMRRPEGEIDALGDSVNLDEAGYTTVKNAARAPAQRGANNMKRFVCRVISKIKCKVTDSSSLLGFVDYYDGSPNNQQQPVRKYQRLESELATLCHAGGKWIVPAESWWTAP